MSHMLYLVIGALSGQEQVVIELMALVPTCKFAFDLAVMSTVAYSKCRLTCVLFNGSRPISYVSLIRDTGTAIRVRRYGDTANLQKPGYADTSNI